MQEHPVESPSLLFDLLTLIPFSKLFVFLCSCSCSSFHRQDEKVKGAIRSLGRALSFRTRSQTSSRAPSYVGSDMDVDAPTPSVHATSSSSSHQEEERYELTDISHIKLLTRPEKGICNMIRHKEFTHTPMFDVNLLHENRDGFRV